MCCMTQWACILYTSAIPMLCQSDVFPSLHVHAEQITR
jgi:hypothetical protein